jgi:hypothetical protein
MNLPVSMNIAPIDCRTRAMYSNSSRKSADASDRIWSRSSSLRMELTISLMESAFNLSTSCISPLQSRSVRHRLHVSTSSSVGFGKHLAEPVESAFPGRASICNPLLNGTERHRFDPAGADAADLLRPDQSAFFKHLKVLNDRRQRHIERPRELAHRRRPAAQPLHHDPPGRVRQRLEDEIEWSTLVKHLLKYCR